MRQILMLAIVVGSGLVAGFLSADPAPAAGSHYVKWMQPMSQNWEFCVGYGGAPSGNPYHSGNAIDIFADETSPCGNFETSHPNFDAHTFTYAVESFGFLLVIYDADNIDGPTNQCDGIKADLYEPAPGGGWAKIGDYIYLHATRAGGSIWTELTFAPSTWQSTHIQIGATFQDHSSCLDPDDAFHVHAYTSFTKSTAQTNGSLAEDTTYSWDDTYRWLHQWEW